MIGLRNYNVYLSINRKARFPPVFGPFSVVLGPKNTKSAHKMLPFVEHSVSALQLENPPKSFEGPSGYADDESSAFTLIRIEKYETSGTAFIARVCKGRLGSASLLTR